VQSSNGSIRGRTNSRVLECHLDINLQGPLNAAILFKHPTIHNRYYRYLIALPLINLDVVSVITYTFTDDKDDQSIWVAQWN